MPTLTDIARVAKVSPATVSRALNSQEKGVRTKAAQRAKFIRQLAQEMGYENAASVAPAESAIEGHAAFIMRDAYTSPFDFEFIAGASDRLQESGFSLTILTLNDLQMKGPLLFRNQPFDFLIVRHVPVKWRRHIEDVADQCVWLDTNEWRPTGCLRRDEFHAGFTAARQAIEAGFEHILYIGSGLNHEPHYNVIERRAGTEKAAADAAVPLVYLELSPGKPTDNLARDYVQLLSPRMAVVATDSGIAEWCAHQAAAEGLVPGRHFGLVSCCETHRQAWSWPQLSRVSFDRRALGEQAAEMQLRRLQNSEYPGESIKVRGQWLPGSTLSSHTP